MTDDNERRLAVGGCSNFRDLGGYVTADGKHRTRWRRLYRSDQLGKIEQTAANLQLLRDTLRVHTTIDLRGADEKRQDPFAFAGVEAVEIAVEPGNVMRTLFSLEEVMEATAIAAMVELNGMFVRDFKAEFSRFLKLVIAKGAASPDSALEFNCSAGKDRTGYAAALILLTLGVDRATVFEDYLLTNKYYAPPSYAELRGRLLAGRIISDAALDAFYYVKKEYLTKALEVIDTEFGGVEKYVCTELGITPEEVQQLKVAYLEPV